MSRRKRIKDNELDINGSDSRQAWVETKSYVLEIVMSFISSPEELDSKDPAREVMLQECYFDIIVLEIFQKRETWRDEYKKKGNWSNWSLS